MPENTREWIMLLEALSIYMAGFMLCGITIVSIYKSMRGHFSYDYKDTKKIVSKDN